MNRSTLRNFMTMLVSGDQHDLTGRQLSILLIVYGETNEQTIKAITQELNISKPTISRAVDRLVELNLVDKRKDPKDRRSVIVGQTHDGKIFVNTIEKYLQEAREKYFEMLFRSPGDMDAPVDRNSYVEFIDRA